MLGLPCGLLECWGVRCKYTVKGQHIYPDISGIEMALGRNWIHYSSLVDKARPEGLQQIIANQEYLFDPIHRHSKTVASYHIQRWFNDCAT